MPVRQKRQAQVLARLVQQVAESRALFADPALERALAQAQFACHLGHVRLAAGDRAPDQDPDLVRQGLGAVEVAQAFGQRRLEQGQQVGIVPGKGQVHVGAVQDLSVLRRAKPDRRAEIGAVAVRDPLSPRQLDPDGRQGLPRSAPAKLKDGRRGHIGRRVRLWPVGKKPAQGGARLARHLGQGQLLGRAEPLEPRQPG